METSFSFWVLWRKKQRWERSCSRLQNRFCFFSVSSDLFWYTIITAYNYCRERYSFSSSEMAHKEMLKPQGRGQRTLRLQLQSSLHPLPGKQIIRWAIRAQINHHLTQNNCIGCQAWERNKYGGQVPMGVQETSRFWVFFCITCWIPSL